MLIVMEEAATPREVQHLLTWLRTRGAEGSCHQPGETLISVPRPPRDLTAEEITPFPGVSGVRSSSVPWLVSRERQPESTVVEVCGRKIGGDNPPVLIAGPCAVESRDQLFRIAEGVLEAGADLLRGGAFKPRTSPYSFQGLGEAGLELLAEVREAYGLPVVVEMRDAGTLDLFLRYPVDVIQIGARNMQNFELLRLAGKSGRPVLLKRGPACSVDEWLLAAEYVSLEGNPQVVLCERGITPPHGSKTRYLLDVAAVPVAQRLTHLPVIADPSHAAGAREYVGPLARAAVAAGAHGLLVEVHHEADRALCDGRQSLSPEQLLDTVEDLRAHGYPLGRVTRPRAAVAARS